MLLKNHIFFILVFLLPVSVFAQVPEYYSPLDTSSEKNIKLKENFFTILDTVYSNSDTLVVRKDLKVSSRDRFMIRIDSVVVGNHVIIFSQGIFSNLYDTLVIAQDTIFSKDEKVLMRIKEFSEKDNFFSKLISNIFIFDEKPSVTSISPDQHSDEKYDTYEGKIIRNIDVKILNVSGYSLVDPERKPHGFARKSLNALHIKSHKSLIRNRLLFEKGDVLVPLKISETERLFREESYVYDARIIVQDTVSGDSVDVLVLVQDVWSISAKVNVGGLGKYRFSVKDVNFLGFGQVLDSRISLNPDFPSGYNYWGAYTINNIYKTFITGRLYYSYEAGETRYGVGLNREFISPAIKWAGGATMGANHLFHPIVNQSDSIISRVPYNYWRGDFWLGYGVNISSINSRYKGSRLIFSGRVIPTKYNERPILPDSIENNYHDNYFYLSSIGIVRRRYYKDKYIFRFGRTEDVPEGDLIALTAGLENNISSRRPYVGIDIGGSRYFSLGYLFLRFGAGGFYENSRLNEGVFLSHLLYFTPLIKVNTWKGRIFVGGRYTEGIRSLSGSYININQEQGLRGFSYDQIKGTSKFVVNCEVNVIPPLNLLGFRMAMILYSDFAWIGTTKKLIDKRNLFSAFGVGLRVRNDHLIFNSIQVFLGYYPQNQTIGDEEFQLFHRNRFFFNYYDLNFLRPSTLPFQ